MKKKLIELIDFEKVNVLLEGFNKTTGFVTAILDLDGKVLSKSGWRQICTEFHRVHPETSKKCKISDTELAGKLAEGEKYHYYKCLNGLVDVAVPIVIKGEHIGNLFTGQFFFEKPKRNLFIRQAKKYNFDTKKYIDALEKVPVVSEEKVKIAMDFLQSMTLLISEMGAQNLEQVKLNTALAQSEEKFRLLYDNSPDMYISVSPDDASILLCNQTFLKETGYSKEEIIGSPIFGVYHTDCLDDAKVAFQQFITKGEVKNKELILKRKNGSKIDVSLNVYAVRDANGKILYSMSSWRNITEIKKVNKALSESEEKFSKAFNKSPLPLSITDFDIGQRIDINEKFVETFGYSREQLLSGDFQEMNLAVDKNEHKKAVDHIIHNGFLKDHPLQMHTKNGNIRDLLVSAARISTEKKNQFIVSIIDITERKQLEEEIQATLKRERLLADIVRESSVGIAIGYPDGRLGMCNSAFQKITGYNEEELKTIAWKTVFAPPEWKESELAKLHKLYRTKKPLSYEKEYIRKDGTRVPIELLVNPRFDKNDEIEYYFAFVIDITERKKIEHKITETHMFLSKAQKIGKIGTWKLDIVKNKLFWTDENYSIFGVKIGTPLSYDIFINCVHPEDREFVNHEWTSKMKTNDYDIEHRLLVKDKVKWVREKAEITFNSKGEPVLAIGYTQDITDKKLAEEEIEKHRKHLKQLVKIRTAELESKNEDLEQMNKLFVGRELRMVELKEKIKDLQEKIKN